VGKEGGQGAGSAAALRARLRGQHGESLDATFAISCLSFFIYFAFVLPAPYNLELS